MRAETKTFARRRSFIAGAAAAVLLTIGLVALPAGGQPPAAQQQGFSFALIGDLGYYAEHEPWLDNVLADINRHTGLAFVGHVGDLSRPVLGCTDELLARRLAQFRASAHPLVFTPGDNDWTDCHDAQGVKGGEPLARLANLRAKFFAGDQSLGKRTMALTRQSAGPDAEFAKFRENVRWDFGGVTFLTLHVVGSNNNLGRTPEGDAEYAERNRANLAWLRQGFAHARARDSRAVVILQQANIFPNIAPIAGREVKPSGFADLRALVESETIAFGKPVMLVHGDSHFFRIDNPLWARPPRGTPGIPALENFTRVETFGTPNHHWLEVIVDASGPSPFTYRPRIVAANVIKR